MPELSGRRPLLKAEDIMYVHCADCDWEQDDFWSESYNPIKSLQDWQETLLDFETLDQPAASNVDTGLDLTNRQVVADALVKAARSVLNMKFLTPEAARAGKCPKCGGHLIED